MEIESSPRRKRIRLDADLYFQTHLACSISISVKHRRPVFANNPVAAAAVDVLKNYSNKTKVMIYGYCVMPDHIHLVLSPSTDCDVVTFVGQYKNLVQREAWQLGVQGAFWQRAFWDHYIKADEGLDKAVQYVLENPVRGGLADVWTAYEFSGSLVFEL